MVRRIFSIAAAAASILAVSAPLSSPLRAADTESVRWTQDILKKHDYYIGEVSGRMGPLTRSALRQFQLDRHDELKMTGALDEPTLEALEKLTGTSAPVAARTAPKPAPRENAARHARPAPPPSKTVEPAPAQPTAEDIQAIATFLGSWRKAWMSRNASHYLAAYAPEFRWEGGGVDAWTKKKSRLLGKAAFIDVELTDIAVNATRDGWEVEFRQAYRSDSLKDRGFKRMLLGRGAEMRILRESWVPESRGRKLKSRYTSLDAMHPAVSKL